MKLLKYRKLYYKQYYKYLFCIHNIYTKEMPTIYFSTPSKLYVNTKFVVSLFDVIAKTHLLGYQAQKIARNKAPIKNHNKINIKKLPKKF